MFFLCQHHTGGLCLSGFVTLIHERNKLEGIAKVSSQGQLLGCSISAAHVPFSLFAQDFIPQLENGLLTLLKLILPCNLSQNLAQRENNK